MTGEGGGAYRRAGVDVGEADRAVDRFKGIARRTFGPDVLTEIGHFAGLFRVPEGGGVLVASADGVGTKLVLARDMGRLNTVGIDLVAMVVNDLLCLGARPLFLLDYLAVGRLDAEEAATIVSGVAEGCRQARCALLGGETAELSDLFTEGGLDLAGFGVGIAPERGLVSGGAVRPGDVVLALASSGFHSNGYTLVRRILREARLDLSSEVRPGVTLGDAILAPTRIYVRSVLTRLTPDVHAVCHVTGGGIAANLVRVLPVGTGARIDLSAVREPAAMRLVREAGGIGEEEARTVFNMGAGLLLVVGAEAAPDLRRALEAAGETVAEAGEIVEGPTEVVFVS